MTIPNAMRTKLDKWIEGTTETPERMADVFKVDRATRVEIVAYVKRARAG